MSAALEGKRLLLRPVEEEDADLIVRWRSLPGIAAWMFGSPPTPDGHRAWVRRLAVRRDRLEYVMIRREDGLPVGTAGLAGIDPDQRRAEFGILLGEAGAGPGIAAEGGALLLDHAFRSLGLERVFLHAFADNVRALRFFLRLGFREEGLLRRHARKDGQRRDVRVMGLLSTEWAGR